MPGDTESEEDGNPQPGPDPGKPEKPPAKPKRRIGWWVARLAFLLSLGAIAGLFLLSRSPWVSQLITRVVADSFNSRFPATLSVERAILHPFDNAFELKGIRIVPYPPVPSHRSGNPRGERGEEVPVRLDKLELIYDPLSLLQGDVRIRELHLARPQVSLRVEGDGRLNLQGLISAIMEELSRREKGRTGVSIDRIRLSQGGIRFQDDRHRLHGELSHIRFKGVMGTEKMDLIGLLKAEGQLSFPGASRAFESLVADLYLIQGSLILKRLEMESEGLELSAQGKATQLGSRQPALSATFTLKAPQKALNRLAFARNLNLKGDFRAQGQLEGHLTAPRATLEMTSPQGSLQDVGFRHLRGVAQVTLEGVRLTHLSAETLGGRLQGKGWLPFSFEKGGAPPQGSAPQQSGDAESP